ncbi:sulfurtransferase [Elysia marginata]|uniref:Sulfurtransferase n=1 Tax=Elysia marginata TaxID=1093978 RepID=A0AAV4JH86_9GAST|nr:sulfurtransferase [Elysia marginata]
MTISKISTLVTTSWLRQQIQSAARSATISNKLRVIDTSWMPNTEAGSYREFYQQGHIPTALFFDWAKLSPVTKDSAIGFPIPDPNVFQDYVEDLGISNHTHVVAYDRFNSRTSFRTWYYFRLFGHNQVSVLDGGLRKWVSDGNHVTTEEIHVEPEEFDVKFQPHLLRDYESMVKNMETEAEQVLDATGAKGHRKGHIPGAISIPYDTLFNEDGTMRSAQELKKLFDDAGVSLDREVTSSCLLGLTACGLIAAAHILGKENVPLYNGSFAEWSALSSPDMISTTE